VTVITQTFSKSFAENIIQIFKSQEKNIFTILMKKMNEAHRVKWSLPEELIHLG